MDRKIRIIGNNPLNPCSHHIKTIKQLSLQRFLNRGNSQLNKLEKMEMLVFEPISTGDSSLFGIIVFGAIVCLALGLWGLKEKKQIVWMLGFFGVVILGGNALFTKFSQSYITPIAIYEDKVDTPIGMIDFDDLVSAKIITDGMGVKKTLTDNSPPEKVLILESKKQKSVLLAESQYPIIQIKMALDKQMAIYNKK